MTKNETFYFLGKCLTIDESEEKNLEVISMISQKKVDWDHFVKAASNHLVLPSVYLRFKKNNILYLIPEELSDFLKLVYELNYKRNIAVLGQIDRINRLFASEGIVPIYLKGAANLIDHLYEDMGERMLGDIDLLVSDNEFLVTVNLLKSKGYEPYYPFFEDQRSETKHYPRLVHPTEPADVEVHRTPVDTDRDAFFNYEVILPEIKQIETVPHCFVLSDRHKVILNFMHAFMAKDVRLMHMVSFRNMIDLLLLSHRVDIYEALEGQTKYVSKALVYADYMHHVMAVPNNRNPGIRSRLFIRRHELLLSSKFLFRVTRLLTILNSLFWTTYMRNAIGFFLSKPIRISVVRKLKDPTWYKRHLKLVLLKLRSGS